MDCETFRELIDTDEQMRAVAVHVAGCPACRAEARFSRRVEAAVAAMPRVPAPAVLAERVMAEVREKVPAGAPASPSPQLSLRPRELGWLAAAAALIALIVVVIRWWSGPAAGPFSGTAFIPWIEAMRLSLSTETEAVRGELWRSLLDGWGAVSSYAGHESAYPATWLFGLAVFALGFAFFLSWRPSGRMEDVHG